MKFFLAFFLGIDDFLYRFKILMSAYKDYMIAFKASRPAQTLMAHLSVLVTTGTQVTERHTASQKVRMFSSLVCRGLSVSKAVW